MFWLEKENLNKKLKMIVRHINAGWRKMKADETDANTFDEGYQRFVQAAKIAKDLQKMEFVNFIEMTGNNGGDIINIINYKDNMMTLTVGNCCVYTFVQNIPVEVLTTLFTKLSQDNNFWPEKVILESGWSTEYKEKLLKQYHEATRRMRPMTEPLNRKINLKVGARVKVTKDDGSVIESTVKYEPWQLGHGQWVIGIEGIKGGYMLERVEEVV